MIIIETLIAIIISLTFWYIIIKLIIENIKPNKTVENKLKENNITLNPNINEEKINYYKNQKKTNTEKNKTEQWNNYYKQKKYITTLNENEFYKVLIEIVKELDLILYSQVSLYAIIQVKNEYKEYDEFFDNIKSKSIDFVIVDKKTNKIKICIELDDNTHKQWKRKQRDKFINKLFDDLKIPLLRYPVYPKYYKETLKKKILEKINNTY